MAQGEGKDLTTSFSSCGGANPIGPPRYLCDCGQEMACPQGVKKRLFHHCRACSWRNLFDMIKELDNYIKRGQARLRWLLEDAQTVLEMTRKERLEEMEDHWAKKYEWKRDQVRINNEELYGIQMDHVADFVKVFGRFTPEEKQQWEKWKAEAQKMQKIIEDFDQARREIARGKTGNRGREDARPAGE